MYLIFLFFYIAPYYTEMNTKHVLEYNFQFCKKNPNKTRRGGKAQNKSKSNLAQKKEPKIALSGYYFNFDFDSLEFSFELARLD